jgi:hypothetical protein
MPGLDDRWATRDYPVLEWIVAQFDSGDPDVQNATVSAALDLSDEDAAAAVRNLERGGYLTAINWFFGDSFAVGDITERALRETGAWPSSETVADQLMWFLEQKVQQTQDPEARGRWTRIRDGFAGAGRDFAVEIAAAMATRTIGG